MRAPPLFAMTRTATPGAPPRTGAAVVPDTSVGGFAGQPPQLPGLGVLDGAEAAGVAVERLVGRRRERGEVGGVLGVVVGLLVGWIGLPTPALIGTLVGLFNFIPYLGPLLSLSMITIVSALTFDTLPQILTAPLVFSAIALVEGQAIQPVVLGRHLSTTPVVMFLWVVFWGWLWGVGGVVVAVPLLVVVKICAEHIPSWAAVAEFLGRD